MLGAFIQGLPNAEGRVFAGGTDRVLDAVLPILTGIALIFGYGLLDVQFCWCSRPKPTSSGRAAMAAPAWWV